jgi:hypothetical protein
MEPQGEKLKTPFPPPHSSPHLLISSSRIPPPFTAEARRRGGEETINLEQGDQGDRGGRRRGGEETINLEQGDQGDRGGRRGLKKAACLENLCNPEDGFLLGAKRTRRREERCRGERAKPLQGSPSKKPSG